MITYTEEQYAVYMECIVKLTDNGLFPLGVISKQDIEDRYNVVLTQKEFDAIYGEYCQSTINDYEEQGLEFIVDEVENEVYPNLITY